METNTVMTKSHHLGLSSNRARELKKAVNMCSQNDERLKTIEIMKSKGIDLSEKNIEAVQLALRGTSLEDAKKLNKLFSDMCVKGDKDLENFKGLMAETIAKTTIGLIKSGLNLELSKEKTLNQYVHVTTSAGGFASQKFSNHKRYAEIFKGHFIDEDPKIQSIINSLSTSPNISKSDEAYLSQNLKKRYEENLNEIIDEMDAYDFTELIYQSVLGADGELTMNEVIEINRAAEAITDFDMKSDGFCQSIKALVGKVEKSPDLLPMLEAKIESYAFFKASSSYLKKDSSIILNQLLKSASDRDIESLKALIEDLPSNHFANSKFLDYHFRGPFNEKISGPHQFENVANGVLSLIGRANVAIKFDEVASKVRHYQRASCWGDDIYSSHRHSSMSISMITSQTEKRLFADYNKRIEGFKLLTSSQEYYGTFMNNYNDKAWLLDFQFKFLGGCNFLFDVYASFFNGIPSLISFIAIDKKLTVNITGEALTLELLKSYSSTIERKIDKIGYSHVEHNYFYQSMTEKSSHHDLFVEQSAFENFEVTI